MEYEIQIKSNDGDIAIADEHNATFERGDEVTVEEFLRMFPVGGKFRMKLERGN